MLSVEGGREGGMVGKTDRKGGSVKRKRTERGRPWASAVKQDSWNVCCTFQGYTPLALSLLRIHTVFMRDSHYPSSHWVTHLSPPTCCGHQVVSQFNNPDTTSNAVCSVIHTHNTYWWKDMFWTAHFIHCPPPSPAAALYFLLKGMSMYTAKLALSLWAA